MVLADWLLGPSILIAFSLLCKYVNSLFLLTRARIQVDVNPALIIKAQCLQLMFTWQLWWPDDRWGNLFLFLLLKRTEPPRSTWRHSNVASSCHAIVHLETVLSGLSAVFRSTVRHAGLRLDVDYHAVNHRELQNNRRGRFRLEPDWLNNILIPASSDNGSKNGLRKLPSTLAVFLACKRSTAWHDSAA